MTETQFAIAREERLPQHLDLSPTDTVFSDSHGGKILDDLSSDFEKHDDSETDVESENEEPADPDCTAVSKAMGSIMDRMQTDLNYPVEGGKTASTTLTYSVSAQAQFDLSADWEIFKGFKLQSVQLKMTMAKGSQDPGIVAHPNQLSDGLTKRRSNWN